MTTQTVTNTFECEMLAPDGTIYNCNVDAHAKCYYSPGRFSGPPEDCYPDESDMETSFEILDCVIDGMPVQLDPALLYELEPLLPVEWMESQLWDQFMSGDSEY